MTLATPTFSQIRGQVAAIQRKHPQAAVIGIRFPGRWTGAVDLCDGAQHYLILQCDSPLAMRQALRQPTPAGTTKVLLTSLDQSQLSEDILLRLARRRLYQIDAWQIARDLFQARAVDPRISRQTWIAEALLDTIPGSGYQAARGGFLDAETVWPILLQRMIGLEPGVCDARSLLKWSLDQQCVRQFCDAPAVFQQAAIEWLTEQAGRVAGLILQTLLRLRRSEAVPIGLALSVVFHPRAAGSLDAAAIRLEERYLGAGNADAELMRRWSAAATEVVRGVRLIDDRLYQQTLQQADQILVDVQAQKLASLSDTSPLGFDQRLEAVGRLLAQQVRGRQFRVDAELLAAGQAVREHDRAAGEERRIERIEMAIRLVRWLGLQQQTAPSPRSLPEAADLYQRDRAFADVARLSLRHGDPVRELSESYSLLATEVQRIREAQSQKFAELLADWTQAGSRSTDVLPVENILDEIVAPLVVAGNVLLIVMDGMSVAVCRELLSDLTSHGWVPIVEPGRKFNRPGLAVIPSVTEFSRTSLLSGRLSSGGQPEELAGFSQHPALRAASRKDSPPALFHKLSLQDSVDAVLSQEIRREIASAHRRIVGVVINAVDDHLAKGEQIDVRWSRDRISVLPALLHEARVHQRRVVLTADHGHMIDCGTSVRPGDGGERWRTAAGGVSDGEIRVRGSRVLAGGGDVIVPWTERVRYGIKKNGYHGGVTDQELVVPIVVLSSSEKLPSGWQEQGVDTPAWWDELEVTTQPAEGSEASLRTAVTPEPGHLFAREEFRRGAEVPAGGEGPVTPEWVVQLLASPVFAEQRPLAGRSSVSDEQLARLLTLLDERGGKMTTVALARALSVQEVRMRGLLVKVQQLLNVDGYSVMIRDEVSNTVEFNRELLLRQFDLIRET